MGRLLIDDMIVNHWKENTMVFPEGYVNRSARRNLPAQKHYSSKYGITKSYIRFARIRGEKPRKEAGSGL